MLSSVRLRQTGKAGAGKNASGEQGTFGCNGRHRGYF
jgi:hypothetical protein